MPNESVPTPPPLTPAPLNSDTAHGQAQAAIALGQVATLDPRVARLELDRIQKDPAHDYWVRDKDPKAHKHAVETVRALVERVGAAEQAARAARRAAQPPTPPPPTLTMADVAIARARLTALHADRTGPLWNRNDPGHKAARAEFDRLTLIADAPRRRRDRQAAAAMDAATRRLA